VLSVIKFFVGTIGLLVLIFAGSGRAFADGEAQLAEWVEDYAIERPWEGLSNVANELRRHRGAVAHVDERIRRGGIPEQAIEHLYDDLEALLALKNDQAILDAGQGFSDYQKHFQIDVFQLWKMLLTGGKSSVRRGEKFREIYFSAADGHGVAFEVRLPPMSVEKQGGIETQRLPLVVALKGSLRIAPSGELPFIEIRPSRREVWAYRAMSAYDIMQAIEFMKAHYPVDANRVYLIGYSAGGSGAMNLASVYADQFAAVLPMVAAGTGYSLFNFQHLPVAFHHGTDDWTSSICNARVQARRMDALGCPVQLVEYPNVGHTVPLPHRPIADWLFAQRRESSPGVIAHECEAPDDGRSSWLKIEAFRDAHRPARVEAEKVRGIDGTKVVIEQENVETLSLDRERLLDEIVAVEIDGSALNLEEAKSSDVHLQFEDGRWRVADINPDSEVRAYQAGAANNLYRGEPLLVVYGTANGRGKYLRSAAQKIAACGGAHGDRMHQHFPIAADVDLTEEQQAGCNLIVVGTPQDNRIAAALLVDLPLSLDGEKLVAGGRAALSLSDRVLSLVHPNSQHRQRLVYLVAPFTDEKGLVQFAEAAPYFLMGADGFNRISQPDLCVQTLDRCISRRMQFDKHWQWIKQPGEEHSMPPKFGGTNRSEVARAFMRVMQRKSSADFALWWGPADKGMWGMDFNYLPRYDSEGGNFSEADFRTRRHAEATNLGSVNGVELKEIWRRWGENGELLFEPGVSLENIDDDQVYRLNFPADLYIKLGQRKKVLADPSPGPSVMPEEAMTEIFR